jgi:cytochrome c oxidase assembly factor CtaG
MPSLGQVLGDWSFEPVPMVLAACAIGLYVHAAAARVRRWPAARSVSFVAGVLAVVFALGSGLDRYGDELLSIHMIQHLVLTLVAPPLLIAGRPLELALRAGHRGVLERIVRLRVPPLAAWAAFVVVMAGTHLPPFYDAAVRHPLLHELEHALYLASALVFWVPLIEPRRPLGMVGRLLYLMLAMPVMSVIGVILDDSRSLVYPVYAAPARAAGVSALADQSRAGAIMWVLGSVLMAVAALVVAWLALAREEERARRREAYEELELSA